MAGFNAIKRRIRMRVSMKSAFFYKKLIKDLAAGRGAERVCLIRD